MTEHLPRVSALSWGVKQSFRTYVEAAGGVIEVRDGAERAEDGAFTFAAAPGGDLRLDAEGKLSGQGSFLGEVRFAAHGGMLSVCLADPILEIGPSRAVVTVADSSARDYRLEVAQLDLGAMTSGEAGEIVIPATVSMHGSQWLGDHYPPRTPLDPVRLILARR
ncbi:MAG: HtaA domain-containing protein [Phenylobacterium sp.]|uniref:HtaA domain-containing protein n=1 Tax=Phenylobacterium sp. TaxID=1871053 RepID=UPI002737497D|nr:HtaA domain-containing protein [Phenylobacterium sp.]MDP3748052.1 HtaA domain-containing protein [Phenylobacterium sp.]